MNYLAHIHLSGSNDEILTGNFISDFIRNKEVVGLSAQKKNGVLLHRHIDAYTDIHPIVRNVTKIFRQSQRKYAPVVADIVFDYFLVKSWNLYNTENLSSYKSKAYVRLSANVNDIPDKAAKKVIAMCSGDFISSYESLEGLTHVFKRMDKRSSFPSHFVDAIHVLVDKEEEIHEHFLQFYPELISQCEQFRGNFDSK
jgi:acyl carrier protein phosphodiesterase